MNSGTIASCVVKDSLIIGNGKLAGSVAAVNSGAIVDCNSSAVVSKNKNDVGGFIGGIASENSGSISNSSFSGKIMGYAFRFGGIAATNSGLLENNMNLASLTCNSSSLESGEFGGIVGFNNGDVNFCTNRGTVADSVKKGNGVVATGGIAGKNDKNIYRCENYATVTGYFLKDDSNYPNRRNYVGGIAGINSGSISVSANFATVRSGSHNAGICAYNNKGTVHDVKNEGSVKYGLFSLNSGTFRNAFSAGTTADLIPKNSKCDYCYEAKIWGTHCTLKPGASGRNYPDDFNCVKEYIEYHSSDLIKIAWNLNTDKGSVANTGIWSCDGSEYPVLAGETHLPIYKVVFEKTYKQSGPDTTYTDYNGHVALIPTAKERSGYYFKGWYNADGVKLTASTVIQKEDRFNANYVKANEVTWHIKFVNYDDQLLFEQDVFHQATPAYIGLEPTKEGNAQYSYVFAGWSPAVKAASGDQVYKATFTQVVNKYPVEFYDYNGNMLANLFVEYGSKPNYTYIPTRNSTEEWNYKFKKWSPDVVAVTGPAKYVTEYDSTKVQYKVIFLNGSDEYSVQMVDYGSDAVLPEPPTSAKEGYVFTGWKGDYTNITKSVVLRAQFAEASTVLSSSEKEEVSSSSQEVVSSSSAVPSSSSVAQSSSSAVASSSSKTVSSSSAKASGSSSSAIPAVSSSSKNNAVSSSSQKVVSSSSARQSSSSVAQSSSSAVASSSSKTVSSSSAKASSSSSSAIPAVSSSSKNNAVSSSSQKAVSSSSAKQSSSSVAQSSSSAVASSSSKTVSSSSAKASSSSSSAIPTVSSSSKNNAVSSSSQKAVSSSSAKQSSSSVAQSSSSAVASSSSKTVSSSSAKASSSSSSAKTTFVLNNELPLRFKLSAVGRTLQISGAEIGKKLSVFDMHGRVIIAPYAITNSDFMVNLPYSGSYIVQIGAAAQRISVK